MPVADPSDVADYQVDWTQWLAVGETISASLFTIPTGITVDPAHTDLTTKTSTTATVWLTGGTPGGRYSITNHITTNQGRQAERSFLVRVENR